jgi:hypothetical protein
MMSIGCLCENQNDLVNFNMVLNKSLLAIAAPIMSIKHKSDYTSSLPSFTESS